MARVDAMSDQADRGASWGRLTTGLTVVAVASTSPTDGASPSLTTPKKKWMQLWSTQHASPQAAQTTQPQTAQGAANSTNRSDTATNATNAPNTTTTSTTNATNANINNTNSTNNANNANNANTDSAEEEGEVVMSSVEDGEVPSSQHDVAAAAPLPSASGHQAPVGDLRVSMPLAAESSSLSPSTDRASPTSTSASISPSAKVKEVDGASVGRSRTPSPAKAALADVSAQSASGRLSAGDSVDGASPQPGGVVLPTDRETAKRKQAETVAAAESPTGSTAPDGAVRMELTESERQRLERRKRKKSNWDVGDPRKYGGSVDLAALNLLSSTNTPASHPASFAKFPRQRPAYRHSHSMDSKDSPFQHRASFGNATTAVAGGIPHGSPPPPYLASSAALPHHSPPQLSSSPSRRPSFHHSTSLPLERSRSGSSLRPPPSSRYQPHGGYR